jgi:regulator of sirC expression with transglutaminase-like and TPR domain
MRQAYGSALRLLPTHLEPTGPRQTLIRLVTNLKLAYVQRDDFARAIRASELISLVKPSTQENRDRAALRLRVGDLRGAARDLASYLELEPGAADAPDVQNQLRFISELMGRRN